MSETNYTKPQFATSFSYSQEKPPMADFCEKYFGASWDKGTIFAYKDTIHAKNPSRISPDVEAHEVVHLKQQREFGDADKWWDAYLTDDKFRIAQEMEAYKAQIQYALEHYDRNYRRALKKHIYASFASLSGGAVTVAQAENLLQ